MLISARELIRRSLLTLGAIGEGDPPSSEQVQDAFDLLDEVVEDLNLQPATRVFLRRLTHTLTIGTETYTIGPTGAIVSAIPVEAIDHASYIMPATTNEIPVHVFTSRRPWELITIKSQTGTIPLGLLFEETEPNHTITLWPVPAAAGTLVLYTVSAVQRFADLDTQYQLAKGFGQVMRLQLAIAAGPSFHLPVDDAIHAELARVMANLKRNYAKDVPDLDSDPMLTGGGFFGSVYDLYAGRG